jgi:hypothetical protein
MERAGFEVCEPKGEFERQLPKCAHKPFFGHCFLAQVVRLGYVMRETVNVKEDIHADRAYVQGVFRVRGESI